MRLRPPRFYGSFRDALCNAQLLCIDEMDPRVKKKSNRYFYSPTNVPRVVEDKCGYKAVGLWPFHWPVSSPGELFFYGTEYY